MSISIWTIPVILFFCFLNQIKLCLIAYFIAIIHELGHITAAICCGYEVGKIKILPFGVNAEIDTSKGTFLKNIIVFSAGPLVNLVFVFGAVLIKIIFGISLKFFVEINIYLLVINLLPIYPLDGGRILCVCVKSETNDEDKAVSICRIVSFVLSFAVLILGCFFIIKTKFNYSLLLIAIFLISNLDIKKTSFNPICVYKNFQKVNTFCIKEDALVYDAVKKLNNKFCIIYVIDKDGKIIGNVSTVMLSDALFEGKYNMKIKELL